MRSFLLEMIVSGLLILLTPRIDNENAKNVLILEKCQFGEVIQKGNKILIIGTQWDGEGEIKEDGTLELYWMRKHDGGECHGSYRQHMDGHWVGSYYYLSNPDSEISETLR